MSSFVNLIDLPRERFLFLWTIVGPGLALVTLLILMISPNSLNLLFALTIVLGLPACWYLKKWGVLIGVICLACMMTLSANHLGESPVWYTGLAISTVLTLFITTHSFEESAILVNEFANLLDASQQKSEQTKFDFENIKIKHQNDLLSLQLNLESFAQELNVAKENNMQYLDIIEKTKRDVQNARNDAKAAVYEADLIKAELEATLIKDEHVLQELLEKRKEILYLRDQLQEAQEDLKNLSKETKTIPDETELHLLRDLISQKDQNLFNIQFRLDSTLEDIQEREKELSELQNKEMTHKKIQFEMSDCIETLKREKELFEITIHKLQQEIESFLILKQEKEKLEESLNVAKLELENIRSQAEVSVGNNIQDTRMSDESKSDKEPMDPNFSREYTLRRRAEGMYLQLKNQFSEKSAVLDETRRQLFYTQENLLQLQKFVKEQDQFTLNPQIQILIRHILKMQNQFKDAESFYTHEIDVLHAIIDSLCCSASQ